MNDTNEYALRSLLAQQEPLAEDPAFVAAVSQAVQRSGRRRGLRRAALWLALAASAALLTPWLVELALLAGQASQSLGGGALGIASTPVGVVVLVALGFAVRELARATGPGR